MENYLTGFPAEILVEIFSYAVQRYSEFRCLSRATNSIKISWDMWDALVAQKWSVFIDDSAIFWSKSDYLESPPFPRPLGEEIPAAEQLSGDSYKSWYRLGLVHRENDLPAIEWADGSKEWRIHGELHRDPEKDLPSIILENGNKEWYVKGVRSRQNGSLPSIIRYGIKIWQEGEKVFRIEYPPPPADPL